MTTSSRATLAHAVSVLVKGNAEHVRITHTALTNPDRAMHLLAERIRNDILDALNDPDRDDERAQAARQLDQMNGPIVMLALHSQIRSKICSLSL